MNKLNRIITSSATAIASLPFVATLAHAATEIKTCEVGQQFDPLCQLNASKFGEVIGRIIQLVFVVAIIAALFYLIYGGIKWLMSEGDKTSVEAARQHIISAIVGLIIIFLSYFILNIVIGFFIPNTSLQDLKLPTIGGTR